MMPDVIEVSAQINVYPPRQTLQYSSRHSVYCLMGMTSRPVPVGAPLEVRFKDRLKDQFQRPLHNPVSYRRYPKYTGLTILFRYLYPLIGHRSVGPVLQFLSYLFQKSLDTLRLDVFKSLTINAGCPTVCFRQPVGLFQNLLLADMTVQPPELPVLLGLCFAVYLSPQFLQIYGSLYHSPLPLLRRKIQDTAEPLRSGKVMLSLPSLLLRAHPPPSRLSVHFVFRLIEPTLLLPFPSGTRRASPVDNASLYPCH